MRGESSAILWGIVRLGRDIPNRMEAPLGGRLLAHWPETAIREVGTVRLREIALPQMGGPCQTR
jgi:hypothetical protein